MPLKIVTSAVYMVVNMEKIYASIIIIIMLSIFMIHSGGVYLATHYLTSIAFKELVLLLHIQYLA